MVQFTRYTILSILVLTIVLYSTYSLTITSCFNEYHVGGNSISCWTKSIYINELKITKQKKVCF